MKQIPLPIDAYLEEITAAVQNYPTVLVKASPGSGKTTRLPWAIAQRTGKKTAVLEPRRLAAKMAANRIASENALTAGKEVGYHFRFERNFSSETKLLFYTEGTFLKKFLSEGNSEFDTVILDEFHERHIETDLALAFLRRLQEKKELKLVLMSATLDKKLVETFPDAKLFEIEASLYPVEIHYLENVPSVLNRPIEAKVKKAILSSEGDTLVFLPGMREMLRVKESLAGLDVFLLHGDLSREEQEEAMSPNRNRKIILATNIAESSLTIPGIRTVIDSGIQREVRFSSWNGLRFLEDTPVTKSSAIQRAGRAGRTGPGVCFRLYSLQDFNERSEFTVPELKKSDLTDSALLVSASKLEPLWYENPPKEKWDLAVQLLEKLGAVSEQKLTEIGRKMLEYPVDARVGRILAAGERLQDKRPLLRWIAEVLEEDRSGLLERKLQNYLKTPGSASFPFEKAVLSGFIDQTAKFRPNQNDFIHYSGKIIKAHPSLHGSPEGFYLILDISQRQEAMKVLPIEEEWLWEIEPFPFTEEDEVSISDKILLRKKTLLGRIVIEETQQKACWSLLSPETKRKILTLAEAPARARLEQFRKTAPFERLAFLARTEHTPLPDAPDLIAWFKETEELTWEGFDNFLLQFFSEKLNIDDLDRKLPLSIDLGGRRKLQIHYPLGMDPYLEAPIQDFYGLLSVPKILGGKIPLTLKLLGPHKRPIQVTKDLENFWKKTYQEMKREYSRDYPRHYWPEKPWEAKPYLLKSHLPKDD